MLEDETGLLVDQELREIAEAMKELAGDEEKVREMGTRAREESRKYSWDNFSEKLDEEVEKLVKEKEDE